MCFGKPLFYLQFCSHLYPFKKIVQFSCLAPACFLFWVDRPMASINVGCFKCQQGFSRCDCRYRKWVTLKVRCKQISQKKSETSNNSNKNSVNPALLLCLKKCLKNLRHLVITNLWQKKGQLQF